MTVPKRRITRTEVELRAIADIASALARNWHLVEATAEDLAHPILRAAGQSDGHGTDVPDPTLAAVLSLENHDETRGGVSGALAQLRWVQGRVSAMLRNNPSIATDADATAKASRCLGTVDPTCGNNWVVSPNHPESKYRGLCAKCIKRVQRSDQDHRDIVQDSVA